MVLRANRTIINTRDRRHITFYFYYSGIHAILIHLFFLIGKYKNISKVTGVVELRYAYQLILTLRWKLGKKEGTCYRRECGEIIRKKTIIMSIETKSSG